ncbi:substrate-binding periplasmic protein [Pseudaeromonas sharmana]|uniref:Substrate-binding periplasmic protein n=1 Tax=Pseudaeromonas sharmana TaxID=328412 RepID=A0ABV8CJN4_9GAMM
MRLWPVVILLTPFAMTAMAANPLCPQPLQVGWDPWPPYHFQTEKGEMTGFAIDVLNLIVHDIGCEIEYRERPWKRQLQELKEGMTDIAMEAYYNPDRAEYAVFSDAYSPSRAHLWVKSGNQLKADKIATLLSEGTLIGVTKDFYYGPVVERNRKLSNVQEVFAEETNYSKLLKGRIDGFLGDWLATTWNLKQHGLQYKIVRSPVEVYEAPAFFMLSKRRLSSEFVSRFNAALQQAKKDGRYQLVLDKYTKITP